MFAQGVVSVHARHGGLLHKRCGGMVNDVVELTHGLSPEVGRPLNGSRLVWRDFRGKLLQGTDWHEAYVSGFKPDTIIA